MRSGHAQWEHLIYAAQRGAPVAGVLARCLVISRSSPERWLWDGGAGRGGASVSVSEGAISSEAEVAAAVVGALPLRTHTMLACEVMQACEVMPLRQVLVGPGMVAFGCWPRT